MILFEMHIFKYDVILGILDLFKLLGQMYICIYTFPK